MTGLNNPTVTAAAVIAAGMVLTVLIGSRALKRFGRGLTEMARAMGTLAAEVKNHNQIAATAAGNQRNLEQIGQTVADMDAFLKQWGPVITGVDGYLQQVDGEKYTTAMSGGVVSSPQEPEPVPPAEEVPQHEVPLATAMPAQAAPGQAIMPFAGDAQQVPVGPNPKYPMLPFDPVDQQSVLDYMLTLIPEGTTLDDEQSFGTNYTWRDWARAQITLKFGDLFKQYGLPPLSADMTQQFRRPEMPPS